MVSPWAFLLSSFVMADCFLALLALSRWMAGSKVSGNSKMGTSDMAPMPKVIHKGHAQFFVYSTAYPEVRGANCGTTLLT